MSPIELSLTAKNMQKKPIQGISDFIVNSRLEQIIDCHKRLKVQYEASEQQIVINQANNEIAKHFIAYVDEKKARSTKPSASDLDEKYFSEIANAFEVSTSSDANLSVIFLSTNYQSRLAVRSGKKVPTKELVW